MKHTHKSVAVLAAGLLVLVGAGGTYAATKSSGDSERQAFLDDVAKRLNVDPKDLTNALREAFFDRLDAAVKAGTTHQGPGRRDQEERRERRRRAVRALRRTRSRPRRTSRLLPSRRASRSRPRRAAASAGSTRPRSSSASPTRSCAISCSPGKSLADIAKDKGKSVDDLKAAIKDGVKTKLDAAVKDKKLTQDQEDKILKELDSHLDDLVNGKPGKFGGKREHHRWKNGPGGGPPTAPGTYPGSAPAVPAPPAAARSRSSQGALGGTRPPRTGHWHSARSVELTPVEIRVLGCLVEKQRTTPDAYPLSLNALRLACNQSTNRDPVVDYDEATVRDAAQRLGRQRLVAACERRGEPRDEVPPPARRDARARAGRAGAARGADAARASDPRRAEAALRAPARVRRSRGGGGDAGAAGRPGLRGAAGASTGAEGRAVGASAGGGSGGRGRDRAADAPDRRSRFRGRPPPVRPPRPPGSRAGRGESRASRRCAATSARERPRLLRPRLRLLPLDARVAAALGPAAAAAADRDPGRRGRARRPGAPGTSCGARRRARAAAAVRSRRCSPSCPAGACWRRSRGGSSSRWSRPTRWVAGHRTGLSRLVPAGAKRRADALVAERARHPVR